MSKTKTKGFYVALRNDGSGAARASCVDDDKPTIRDFFRDYAGHEIRHVDGDEMVRLMQLSSHQHDSPNDDA